MNKKTVKDIDVFDKKVLVRVDFNVPIVDGAISDDTRIREALGTINYLIEKGAKVILVSHLGRPDGKVAKKYSLKPVYNRLKELMPNVKIYFSKDVVGDDAKKKAKELKMGQVLLLENVRFEAGEEENDKAFAKKLANLADVYVLDAFGTAHRKHASTYGVAKLLPSAIGFLVEKELTMICDNMASPKRPFVGILGGAKVKDKLGIVDGLLDKVDTLIIGGGMAYTFLYAQGNKIGKSLFDKEKVAECKKVLKKAKEKNVEILLPVDNIISTDIKNTKNAKLIKDNNIPDDYMGVDIGPKTIKSYVKAIKRAKTVIWNGPMGVFETKEFAVGTYKVAKAVSKVKGVTIIGGGDSASAVVNMKLNKKVTHISTGGGASLQLFEGKTLPAVDIIENI